MVLEDEQQADERPRLVTPLFLVVTTAMFAYFVSIGMLAPTLPLFVRGPLDAGNVWVGVTIGAFAFSAVMLRPFVGGLGDRRGRALLVIGGGVLVGFSVFGFIFVTALPLLLTLRLVSGAGEAFFYVGAASVINDIAPDERRGEALSYFSLALFAGLAVGPAIGEWVLHASSFDVVWGVAATSALVAGLVGLRIPDTRPEGTTSERGRIVHPAALAPGFILAAGIWGLATFTTFVPLYALQLGMDGSRLVFLLHAATIILVRSFGARIPDIIGPGRAARIALALTSVGLAVMGVWAVPLGLFVGTFLFALGQAFAFPALMTLAVRGAPPSERGSVVGTFTAFFDLAFGVGAVSAGAFAAALGYRGSFIAAAVVASLGFAWLMVRRVRAKAAAQA